MTKENYTTKELADREVWKDVIGYENLYEVSNHGQVRSFPRGHNSGRLLKGGYTRGYLQVNLCREGKRKSHIVHRVVAIAFLKNTKNKRVVNHLDGNKQNNCVENLEWCSDLENKNHAIRTGLAPERKLTPEAVRLILKNEQRESQVALAQRHGVHQSLISLIISRKTYCYV